MRYFSELTRKMYDTVEDLQVAEAEAMKEKDARKEMADKVQEASKKVSEAYDAYKEACKERDKVLTEFCDKYGSYKTTVRSNDVKMFDPLEELLNFTFWKF